MASCPLLRGLSDLGFALMVVTNQQGIGKGIFSEADLEVIHREMTRTLELEGISLTRVLHCPHLEQDGCFCRKPRPGLIYRALNETPFLIDVTRSVLIGDADSDMQAGLAAGIGTRVFVGRRMRAGGAATHHVGERERRAGRGLAPDGAARARQRHRLIPSAPHALIPVLRFCLLPFAFCLLTPACCQAP
jgi:histidinol-phosphate phosphatase family protein